MIIQKVIQQVSRNNDIRIKLLRKDEVVMWLFNDLSFLSGTRQQLKQNEDKWGQTVLKEKRPDLKLDKQWTNKFGEHLSEEIFHLIGENVKTPVKKENFKPDLEIDDAIIECKAQTYYTTGTAGEKILGCPYKYRKIPLLYGKKLKIICLGGAEKICREQYGNLQGPKCNEIERKWLDFFKDNNIEFVGATDLLSSIVD